MVFCFSFCQWGAWTNPQLDNLVRFYCATGITFLRNIYDSKEILYCPQERCFFLPHHFYFSLKKSIISEEDYKAVKKIYRTQELGNLGQLSKLYNFRDTSWLRYSSGELSTSKNSFKFNPRKCNSTSSFSGCVYRDKSKCLIPHHTRAEDAFLFDRTRIGGLSCVNSHLPFDSQIVLPKNKKDKYKLIYSVENQKKKKKENQQKY